jgi:DNA repair protein RadC
MLGTANYQMLAYSDKELLAKLIGVEEAESVYSANGGLTQVFSGKTKAPEICLVVRELLTRWKNEEMHETDVLSSPQLVRDFLMMHFLGQEFESFVAIFVNNQHHVIQAVELFRGTLAQTSVYPREVLKAALQCNAAAVFFAHNHPSNVTEPRNSDRLLTTNLKQALSFVDVRVLDHFIIAGNLTTSFVEKGLL